MDKRISLKNYIYYNYLCKNIVKNGKGRIIPYKNSVIDLAKTSKIVLHDGDFYINENKPVGSKAEAIVRLSENATLEIKNTSYLNYRGTIEVQDNASVEIGSAYINSDAVILAAKHISLGEEVLISRGVKIFDSDHHPIIDEAGETINPAKDVIIEDHVWIGLNCTILKGSKIGTGAVIAANSLVGSKIKAGTMASGNPARSYSAISWRA